MLKSEILQHYKGNETLIRQLDDALVRYERLTKPVAMHFLNMNEMEAASRFLGERVPYIFAKGYKDALSGRLVIGENLCENDYICCLKASFNSRFRHITHRDVKGALYNLQIEPNRFGDFWVEDDCVYIYCENEISFSLSESFTKIANLSVQFKPSDFQSQIFHFEKTVIHVSSLRLDNVTSEIIHRSRERAKQEICSRNILVNYKTIEDCSFLCNNYDILSLKGFGRFQIIDICVNRKSGNYILTINRFV